jgi:hypothetical protein
MAPPFITQPEVPRLVDRPVKVSFEDTRLPAAFHHVAETATAGAPVAIHAADGQFVASAREGANVMATQGTIPADYERSFRTTMGPEAFGTFLAEFEHTEQAFFDPVGGHVGFQSGGPGVADLDEDPYFADDWPAVEVDLADRHDWPRAEVVDHALAAGLTGAAIQRVYDPGGVRIRSRNGLLVAEAVDMDGSEEYILCETDAEGIDSRFSGSYLLDVAQTLTAGDYTLYSGEDKPLLLVSDRRKYALAHRPRPDGAEE